jgi:hypothetical protein
VKFVTRFISVLLVLLLMAAAFAIGYLHLVGFPEFLKAAVVRQLEAHNIAARFATIRLDLFRGVVATDAVLAEAPAPDEPFASIDQLELHWSWRRILQHKDPLSFIRIANGIIAVPTPADEHGPEQFTATDAYATFRFLDDKTIEIDQLTGVYCGIRLYVTGRFKPREAAPEAKRSPEAGAEERKQQFLFITQAVRELNRLRVTQPPQLDLDFDVDAARPIDAHVTARLRGSNLRYRGLDVDSAALNLEMTGGAIEFRQATLNLYRGAVSVKGRYDVAGGRFDLTLNSTTDPAAFAAVLPPPAAATLRELHVQENPTISARFLLAPETGSLPQLQGTVQTGALVFSNMEFRAISFAVDCRGPELKFSNVSVVTPEGRLTGAGQYHIESSDFTYELDSTLDPTKLLPVMTRVMKRIVGPASFETPPHIIATVTGDLVDPDAFGYDALLTAERCSYRGVALNRASATLRLRQSRLDVQNLILVRDEGQLRGTLLADFNEHRVNFDIHTTANPTEMAGLLGEKAGRIMKSYRFGPVTTADMRGMIDFTNQLATAWTAQVANEGFSYWKLAAARAQAKLVFTNNTMQINDFDADFYDGKLRGRAEFAFANPDVQYHFDFDAESADVNKMLEAMRGHPSNVTGSLTGHAEINGRGSDLAALQGKGNLEITDGILWQAPLFGIFSKILGTTKATSAKATFTIAHEAVTTDDLRIAAGAFTASSHGKLGFDGGIDFRVQAQFLRAIPLVNIPGIILGKALEYKVGGSLSDPSYRAVNLPKELLPHD